MTVEQILEALPQLSFGDRNKVIDRLAELIQAEPVETKEQRSQRMSIQAVRLYEDYLPGSDLLAFDEIEDEVFYEDEQDFEQSDSL